jgi:hypothetical protein
VLPEQSTGRGIVPAQAAGVQDHDLPTAGESQQRRGAVARAAVAGRPGGLAARGVERHERVARAPGGNHDPAVGEERRGALAPLRQRRAVLAHDVVRPQLAPAREIESVQQARRAERVDPPALDERRRARTGAGDHGRVARRVGVRPERPARAQLVGHDALLVAALLLGDGDAVRDREAGPPLADRLAPERFRRPRGPVAREPGTDERGVAARAEELRIGRRGGRRRGHGSRQRRGGGRSPGRRRDGLRSAGRLGKWRGLRKAQLDDRPQVAGHAPHADERRDERDEAEHEREERRIGRAG